MSSNTLASVASTERLLYRCSDTSKWPTCNSKLYLSKSVPELYGILHTMVGNHATYGGAVYVADGTDCKNAQESHG